MVMTSKRARSADDAVGRREFKRVNQPIAEGGVTKNAESDSFLAGRI
jgi:hypothetical protein